MLVRMCFCVCASGYTIWQRERYIINRRLKLPNTKLNHYRVNYRKIFQFLGPLSWKTSRTYFCINHSYKIFSIQSHWSVNTSVWFQDIWFTCFYEQCTQIFICRCVTIYVRIVTRHNSHNSKVLYKILVQMVACNSRKTHLCTSGLRMTYRWICSLMKNWSLQFAPIYRNLRKLK